MLEVTRVEKRSHRRGLYFDWLTRRGQAINLLIEHEHIEQVNKNKNKFLARNFWMVFVVSTTPSWVLRLLYKLVFRFHICTIPRWHFFFHFFSFPPLCLSFRLACYFLCIMFFSHHVVVFVFFFPDIFHSVSSQRLYPWCTFILNRVCQRQNSRIQCMP